jgi:hypothetical protein
VSDFRLEADGAIGHTLMVPMALTCGRKYTRAGAFIGLEAASGDPGHLQANVIYLSPDQAKQLADFLRNLFP